MSLSDVQQAISDAGERVCTKCGTTKPLSEFYFNRTESRWKSHCRACYGARGRAYNKRNSKRRALKTRYGMTVDEFDQMLAAQEFRCLICDRSYEGDDYGLGGLVVDHDHQTGRVRGLLCQACNTAIGLLQDDIVRLERAAHYLREN